MNNKLFLFLGIFAALATTTFSQTTNFQIPVALKVGGGNTSTISIVRSNGTVDTYTRPRVVAETPNPATTETAVKSSVIVNIGSVERIAFRMLNEKRAENGLKPLMWSDDLERVARIHSQNMADFKFFDHRGIDGKMVSDRADCLGVGNWRSIGENIAFNRGYADPITKAVELWLDSPSHRHNLMDNNWKESAVGVAVADDGSYYFTQVFLLKK